eukprot:TRINITY_DN840_c0_g1_i1.p2 TRINITY_DN840_c0_g1~~TRINITY_DN840_c0_g1_i1.p2  ORF type:complete len:230 (-),score=78.47 TRINITY_DN840_c0_g1_i1:262-951(-)
MAYSHFINCLLLTYGPYFIIYKAANLSEHGAFKVSSFSGLAFLITAAVKMTILATIMSSSVENPDFHWFNELNKNSFNIIDIVGIYLLLKSKWSVLDNSSLRIVAVAVGWHFVEALCTNFFYLLLNATGEEFSWKYLSKSLLNNFELFETICIVALVLQMRKYLNKGEGLASGKVIILLFFIVLRSVLLPTVLSYITQTSTEDINTLVMGLKGGYTFLLVAFISINQYM